ncbi:hypothetical protein QDX91_004464 [Salmonella enterica]|nr:hypothetical protein [Salmonella enterica subsp. enterica serovar Sandiego]EEC0251691.1 hypothetical protein [Salmonella enterica subsp. enterica]EJW2129032.1 hypothetical protein [Salmonella enterica]EEE4266515.1 hypothetical protein [Salmonella enterica subsp. enterica serovar Sandiego]EKT1704964.1 hypothetical protein [Salmonella enterica]
MSPQHLQHLMQDLQLRQHKLVELMDNFQTLQQEIADLKARAPHDPEARQRFECISRAMQQELSPINEYIKQIHTHLSFIKDSFQQPGGETSATTYPKVARSFQRRFV